MELNLLGCDEAIQQGDFTKLPELETIQNDDMLLEELTMMQENMEPSDQPDFKWVEVDFPSEELLDEIEEEVECLAYSYGVVINLNTAYFWKF